MGMFDNVSWSTPFGQGTSWNPGDSALGTGKGTPWSAGNKNTPGDYLGAVFNPVTWGAGAQALFGNGTQLDMGGSQRNIDDQASQRASNKAQGDFDASQAQQAATDKKNADWASQGQANTDKSNSLEQTIMNNYKRTKGAGQNLYGGM